MAKAKMKNKQLPSAPTEKTEITGGHIPTPQDLPQRKTSIVASKLAGWWFYVYCFCYHSKPPPHVIIYLPFTFLFIFHLCMYSLRTSYVPCSWGRIGDCQALNRQWVKSNKENVSQDCKKRKKDWVVINFCTWYHTRKYEWMLVLSYFHRTFSLLKMRYASMHQTAA